jgi:hypothetical protein
MVQMSAEDKTLMHSRSADGSRESDESAESADFSPKSLGIFQALASSTIGGRFINLREPFAGSAWAPDAGNVASGGGD